MSDPVLPRAYVLRRVRPDDDPFAAALAAPASEAGGLFWAPRRDRLEAALLVTPGRPSDEAPLLAYVAGVALAEALAVAVPPGTLVGLAWPDRVEVNRRTVGGLRLAGGEGTGGAPSSPLVLGLGVALARDPGGVPPETLGAAATLFDEGCDGVTAAGLLEAFAGRFLRGLESLRAEGMAPLRDAYLVRAFGRRARAGAGGVRPGRLAWIDDDGAGLLRGPEGRRRVGLAEALAAPLQAVRRPTKGGA